MAVRRLTLSILGQNIHAIHMLCCSIKPHSWNDNILVYFLISSTFNNLRGYKYYDLILLTGTSKSLSIYLISMPDNLVLRPSTILVTSPTSPLVLFPDNGPFHINPSTTIGKLSRVAQWHCIWTTSWRIRQSL